jgi:hypothetical protein
VGLSFIDVALVDVCRDNDELIFFTNIYYRYTKHTNELSLKIYRLLVEEGLPFARLALCVSSSLRVCSVCYICCGLSSSYSDRVVDTLPNCSFPLFAELFP